MGDPTAKTTVLIVDDSRLTRRALRTLFESCQDFEVVGEAATGREAVASAKSLNPTLITMDLDMPDVNGLEATEQIMAFAPTRIMVVTGVPRFRGSDSSFEALSRGALELVPKPTAWPATDTEGDALVHLARRLSSIPVVRHTKAAREQRRRERVVESSDGHFSECRLVAIGASTGGPKVLGTILRGLPAGFSAPVIVVQHLTDVFAAGFIDWLQSQSDLTVREALPGTPLEPKHLYVAVRGSHIAVSLRGWIESAHEPPRNGHCPSIDVLFESVAENVGRLGVGVLLTGMGADGAQGLRLIRDARGLTVAQDEESSVVFGMPKAAIELGAATRIVSAEAVAPLLARVCDSRGSDFGEGFCFNRQSIGEDT
jgi:two-component system chemotaxis response regulator CheB